MLNALVAGSGAGAMLAASNRAVRVFLGVVCAVLLTGCAGLRQRNPVPAHLVNDVQIVGYTNIRTWGDDYDPEFQKGVIEATRQRDALDGGASAILAISAGGSAGAFGGGLLCGWGDSGSRPQFAIVTGISTGAFIAPF